MGKGDICFFFSLFRIFIPARNSRRKICMQINEERWETIETSGCPRHLITGRSDWPFSTDVCALLWFRSRVVYGGDVLLWGMCDVIKLSGELYSPHSGSPPASGHMTVTSQNPLTPLVTPVVMTCHLNMRGKEELQRQSRCPTTVINKHIATGGHL